MEKVLHGYEEQTRDAAGGMVKTKNINQKEQLAKVRRSFEEYQREVKNYSKAIK